MDFISATILSGITYDLLKTQASIGVDALKDRLRAWIVDEQVIESISHEVVELKLDRSMDLETVKKQIESNEQLMRVVNQTHSGSGDNVAGDKIIKG